MYIHHIATPYSYVYNCIGPLSSSTGPLQPHLYRIHHLVTFFPLARIFVFEKTKVAHLLPATWMIKLEEVNVLNMEENDS
jgi:hypothetical protein